MGAGGSIFAALFGVFWTYMAVSMGAPWFFALFGIFFIVAAVIQFFYHYKNATGKNRFSAFDITEEGEEPDPLDPVPERELESRTAPEEERTKSGENAAGFCPYCGHPTEQGFIFCRKCGRRLPD